MFLRLLVEHNKTTNLTRIETPQDIRTRHFLDALAGLSVLDKAAEQNTDFSIIDIGSGAGFPGLAIAIARPAWRIVSLEATDKKVRFQQQVCRTLGLNNVQVRHGRAEIDAHTPALREQFDAVTARAVAGLDVLAELTLAFVRPGGCGLFWKGPHGRTEACAAQPAAAQMGARFTAMADYALNAAAMTLIVAEKQTKSPPLYPRQHFGMIKKHPLC